MGGWRGGAGRACHCGIGERRVDKSDRAVGNVKAWAEEKRRCGQGREGDESPVLSYGIVFEGEEDDDA